MANEGVPEQLPVDTNNNNVRVFTCPNCGKTFRSVQALAGHQNAHRTERFNMKRREIELRRQMYGPPMILPYPAASSEVLSPAPAGSYPDWPDFLPAAPAPISQPSFDHDSAGSSRLAPALKPDEEDDGELDLTLKL